MTTTPPAAALAPEDDQLLDLVFSAEGQPTAATPSLTDLPLTDGVEPDLTEQTRQNIARLTLDGITLIEKHGEHAEGLAKLTSAIQLCPSYAASYNNRAQAYLLQQRYNDALDDLNHAITLSGRHDLATTKKSLLQRAMCLQMMQRTDDARADFELAAALGSKFARREAVRLNPYAALCNQYIGQMLEKEQQGSESKEGNSG